MSALSLSRIFISVILIAATASFAAQKPAKTKNTGANASSPSSSPKNESSSVDSPGNATNARNAASSPKRKSYGRHCVSQGSRFGQFPFDGKLPRKTPKGGPEELTFCRAHKQKTCCGRSQSTAAYLSVRKLATSGEASDKCLELWEALECAICHPLMGTLPPPPPICSSFCGDLFAACMDAFFSTDPNTKSLSPCSTQFTICSRASEWTSNASEFCHMAGFRVVDESSIDANLEVQSDRSLQTRFLCFDGSPQLVGYNTFSSMNAKASIHGGKKTGEDELDDEEETIWLRRLFEDLIFGENVIWVFAAFLLTVGAYLRWRGMRGRRKKAAMLALRSLANTKTKSKSGLSETKDRVARSRLLVDPDKREKVT